MIDLSSERKKHIKELNNKSHLKRQQNLCSGYLPIVHLTVCSGTVDTVDTAWHCRSVTRLVFRRNRTDLGRGKNRKTEKHDEEKKLGNRNSCFDRKFVKNSFSATTTGVGTNERHCGQL